MVKRVVESPPSSPSPTPSMVEDAAVSISTDGFPEVPRFSSLLNYLELCRVGVTINSHDLDATITKTAPDGWDIKDEDRALTAVEIVEKMRFAISEDEPERNLNNTFIFMEPVDKITIKREIARECEDEDEEPLVGMRLADIDLTGEEPIETATFDGGLALPQKVCFATFRICACARISDPPHVSLQVQDQFESYQLPLHLRLPAPASTAIPAAVPAESEEQQETLGVALVARAIDRALAHEPAPPPPPPPPLVSKTGIEKHELAIVGQRVSINGSFGVVWKVTSFLHTYRFLHTYLPTCTHLHLPTFLPSYPPTFLPS
jgi:hypothetical protein